ncbi:hypothetical protein KC19_3G034800 [Ceratodon purpureus]|uniref:cysteine--tRNA ligase n=1 Tax=Ceratodon purpureus TaxID=3225 RepID=A0A8T0IHS1_CERPU|nr:hypothetical protein KC19_3G034800 [Ceratodon purpureus]
MAMAARMMSCCATATARLCRAAVVDRAQCLGSVQRLSAAAVVLDGRVVREERVRIRRIHRKVECSSAGLNAVSETGGAESGVQIQLYNTMKRQKELFRPIVPGKVSMYVCGVTSYDYSHIGHARVYVAFDVLFRYLKSVGYDVTYVRNFTDIDDKIINRANELGEDPVKLSRRFCDEFQVDMELLRCLPPNVEPRVTDHIPQIVEMISKIIENGNAYVMEGGDVYFSVDTLPSYGCLSGRKQEENRAGERVTVDNRKQNPADFALWKSTKPGEPAWDSPWGSGRPGWHIECSAMSAEHLGYKFDIHGGGMDLVFPHHENEIAQSCAACADSRVSYWLHNGFVTVDSEKMSKSLGNFFTIREVLELYHPLALRWFLLGTHYRSPVNYSKRQLELASDRIFYLYQALADCEQVMSEQDSKVTGGNPSKEAAELVTSFKTTFKSSMADDLHTPVVVSSFSDPLKFMNNLLHTRKGRKDKSRVASLQLLMAKIEEVLSILGFQVPSYSKVLDEIKILALKRAGLSMDDLAARFQERAAAREAKDYARSDQIRSELAAVGIALMDGGDGTLWRPAAVAEEQLQTA